jgi:hypothetical protein
MVRGVYQSKHSSLPRKIKITVVSPFVTQVSVILWYIATLERKANVLKPFTALTF